MEKKVLVGLKNEWFAQYSQTSRDDKNALGEIYMRLESLTNGRGYENHGAIISKLQYVLSGQHGGDRPTTPWAIDWANRLLCALQEEAARIHLAD
jgi:hypothetical protein